MIIRTPKERGYFVVANTTAQDATISFEALGMLTYLLSKPNDWVVQPSDLQKRVNGKNKTTGKHKVYRIINELISGGYLVRDIERGEAGQFNDVSYDVHETAIPVEDRQKFEEKAPYPKNRNSDKPDTENPNADYPNSENRDITKDGVVQSTEDVQSTEEKKEKDLTASLSDTKDEPQEDAPTVNQMIGAYLGATKSLDKDIYKKSAQRVIFERMIDAGLTPQDVTDYIASKAPFVPTIYTMQTGIMAWYEKNKPVVSAPPEPKKPVSFDPMDDNYDPFADFDNRAANDPDFVASMRPKVMEGLK